MYTYKTFVTDGAFTLMRPVFFTLLLLSVLLCLLIVIPGFRKKFLNGFSVIGLSLLFAIITVEVVYYDAIIIDEIGLGGDPVIFFISLGTLALSLFNPGLYIYFKNKS
ncbi:hypothetical protein [Mesobacillus jeotgali]|uniref:hypothetical protein n=1 Tax=Mesobacillus jeotgali TaxID=129985 RepID=UPI0009A6FD55|nr:hypothetical protein [Mesobacillus jeotgali]